MIPPALWLIALPIGAAPLVYLFRRAGIGAIVAAVVVLFSAWLTMRLPTGLAFDVLGRSIELDQLSQITLGLLFITTAVLFLISSTTVPFIEGIRQRKVDVNALSGAGRTFYPISLATLGFLVAATLSRHLGIAAIFVEAAAISAVFIIQGAQLRSTRAAQRFLVLMSLATPLLLLVSSRIDLYKFSDGFLPVASLQQTALLAGIGFAMWLAVFPFHGWLTATAVEASPASAVFILIAFPTVAFLTLAHLVTDAPWLIEESQLGWVIIVAGVVTASIGGVLTGVQRGLNGLMGYAALYDLGCTLAIFGLGGPSMPATLLAGLIMRALALILIAAGISAIRLRLSGEGFAQIKGEARQLPFATVGVVLGGLILAGVPPTIGFALRWQLLQAVAEIDMRWPSFLALAGVGVAVGYLRGLYALLPDQTTENKQKRLRPTNVSSPQESHLLIIIIILISLICLVLGLFPSLLIEMIQRWAGV